MNWTPIKGHYLSAHAIDRLYERHAKIFADPKQAGEKRTASAYAVLRDSVENKAIHNDLMFMIRINEKYGYKKHTFFVNGEVLFVGVNGVIVTTIWANRTTSNRFD